MSEYANVSSSQAQINDTESAEICVIHQWDKPSVGKNAIQTSWCWFDPFSDLNFKCLLLFSSSVEVNLVSQWDWDF